ncbi:unnamed protein product, partial [Staurois parvus]
MGPPDNRGSWGPCVLTHTQTTPKKAYERYQGHLMGPPTDSGPSGSAQVSKWSVCCPGPSASTYNCLFEGSHNTYLLTKNSFQSFLSTWVPLLT